MSTTEEEVKERQYAQLISEGSTCLRNDYTEDAINKFKEAASVNDRNIEPYLFLITIAKQYKNFESALEYCNKAISIKQKNERETYLFPDPNPKYTSYDFIEARANIYLKLNNDKEAVDDMITLLSNKPTIFSHVIIPLTYHLIIREDWENAIKWTETYDKLKVTHKLRDYSELLNNRAWILLKVNRLEEALEFANKALEQQAKTEQVSIEKVNDPNTLDTRANIYLALGRLDDALADMKRAIYLQSFNQQDGDKYATLAKIYFAKGDIKETVKHYCIAVGYTSSYIASLTEEWKSDLYSIGWRATTHNLFPKQCHTEISTILILHHNARDNLDNNDECALRLLPNEALFLIFEAIGKFYLPEMVTQLTKLTQEELKTTRKQNLKSYLEETGIVANEDDIADYIDAFELNDDVDFIDVDESDEEEYEDEDASDDE